ncbi:hypothetical protein EDB85DRAFT_1960610 [Lactarius pseudohatsudake]|nr:hypothetical protein EDB85DRAFT_1960610 [Lactarius pseudohatsudake]
MCHLPSWSCTPQLESSFSCFSFSTPLLGHAHISHALSYLFCIYFRTKYMHRRESLHAASFPYTFCTPGPSFPFIIFFSF